MGLRRKSRFSPSCYGSRDSEPPLIDTAWRAHAARALNRQHVTPMVQVGVQVGARLFPLLLKLEGRSPSGSTKGRTARALLLGLLRCRRLHAGSHVVESSSGNLAVALALLTAELGVSFTVVVDSKTTSAIHALLATTPARVDIVDCCDDDGSHLSARLERVFELQDSLPGAVWTNQYDSPDNPLAHYSETAPELLAQCPKPPDVVFAAVGTGGTVSGLARRLALLSPQTTVVAVDVIGSLATGGEPGPRLLTGIGSSRRIGFPLADNVIVSRVHDRQAFAHARRLRDQTGVGVGGSAGAILAACARYLATATDDVTVVCLCADGADRYANTIYDDHWLADRDVLISDTDLLPAMRYVPWDLRLPR